MSIPEESKDSLERISQKLYSNDGPVSKHRTGTFHKTKYDTSKDWGQKDVSISQALKEPASPFRNLLIGSMVFFGISMVFAAYMLFGGGNIVSNDKIELSVLGPAYTEGGNEFELQFDVKNGNLQGIQYADLIIEYPKGATLAGDKDTVRLRKFIGDIGTGRSASHRIKLTLFGEEGSERTVKASLQYRVEGSNAVFVKESNYLVHIKSSPLSLTVNSLKEVNSSQDITLDISALANSNKLIQNILLRVEYPSGFIYKSAIPSPTYGNNSWKIGDLDKGNSKSIKIFGSMQGEDGEERSFRVYAGTQDENDSEQIGVIYNSFLQTVAIKKPFLEANLLINGVKANDYVVSSTDEIKGEINWINNLPDKVLDGEIYARIVGASLDKTSVSINGGQFRSSDNTIVWNKETVKELSSVNGGDGGKLQFSFKLLPLFSGNKTIFKNPTLSIEVGVKGRRILENNVPEQISGSQKKNIKVNSNVQLSTRALYYDGPFKNTGGLPPHVDKETTYTVVWTVLNSSNDLSKGIVTTKLPSYIRWVGTFGPQGEDITYNPEDKTVTWNLNQVDQGAGIDSGSRQAMFQVGFTPSVSQIGNSNIILTNETSFAGEDSFTGGNISLVRNGPTIRITSDTGFKAGNDIIAK